MPGNAGFLPRSSGSTKLLLKHFELLFAIPVAHFTVVMGVSRPEYVDRSDPTGVVLQTIRSAAEPLEQGAARARARPLICAKR